MVFARSVQGAPISSGFISQILWLLCDVGVLVTWFLFATNLSVFSKCVLFGGSVIIIAVPTLALNFWAETAFIMNFIMSVSFLFRIDKQMKQSLPIAILKCIGTLSATILNGVIYHDGFILLVGGLCLIADVLFIYVVACKE